MNGDLTDEQILEMVILKSLHDVEIESFFGENTSLALQMELYEYHQLFKQESHHEDVKQKMTSSFVSEDVELIGEISLDEKLERKEQKAIIENRFIVIDDEETPHPSVGKISRPHSLLNYTSPSIENKNK